MITHYTRVIITQVISNTVIPIHVTPIDFTCMTVAIKPRSLFLVFLATILLAGENILKFKFQYIKI